MTTVKRKLLSFSLTTQMRLCEFLSRGKSVMQGKKGASHTTEVLLWILGVCAIVAIIIGLVIVLIKNDIFPMVSDKVKEIFNMK